MQIKSLRIKSSRSWAIADTASIDAQERLKKLACYDKLHSEDYTPKLGTVKLSDTRR